MSKTTAWMIVSCLLTLICILQRAERIREDNKNFDEVWKLKKAIYETAFSVKKAIKVASEKNDDFHRVTFSVMQTATDTIIEAAQLKAEFDEISQKRECWKKLTGGGNDEKIKNRDA